MVARTKSIRDSEPLVKIRAVAYLRMSTDKQDKSIADQLAEIRQLADRDGYEIIRWKEYVDEGISGCEERRDGFQRLVHDAQTIRDFDVILLWSQDRFSRFGILDAAAYWKMLRDADVRIVSVSEGEMSFDSMQGILLACINQHSANDYVKKLAKGVARGMKSAATAGYWCCGLAPFSYVIVPDAVNEKRSRLAVDEEKAVFVREAYHLFVNADLSMRAVADKLNSHGLLTVRGNPWSGQSVADLLSNEVYCGTLIRGRTSRGKHTRLLAGEYVDVRRQDTKPVKQARQDCIVTENAHPAIVDLDTFEKVQRKIAERSKNSRKPRTKCTPLSGLLYCGHCGRKVGVKTSSPKKAAPSHGFYCLSANEPGIQRLADCRYCLNMAVVLDAVLRDIEAWRLSEEQIDRCRQSVTDFLLQQRGQRHTTEGTLNKSLADVRRKLEKAESRLLDTPDDMLPALYKQVRALREQQQRLETDLAAHTRMAGVSEEAVAEEARQLVDTLRAMREKIRHADPAVARMAIESMVDRVEIWTKPVTKLLPGMGRATKRTFGRVKIHYKSPMSTMKAIGPS